MTSFIPEDEMLAPMDFDHQSLSDEELAIFVGKAVELAERFGERLQLGPHRLLYALAALGDWVQQRRAVGDQPNDIKGLKGLADESAPIGQRLDDAGVSMAWIMTIVDDPTTSAPLRRVWIQVLSGLAGEVRRRQRELPEAER